MQTDTTQAHSNALKNEPLYYSYINNEAMRGYATASHLFYLPNRKIYFRCCVSQNDKSNEPEYLHRIEASVRESFVPEKLMGELMDADYYNPDSWMNRAVPIATSQLPVELAERIQKVAIDQMALGAKQKKSPLNEHVVIKSCLELMEQLNLDGDEEAEQVEKEYPVEIQKQMFKEKIYTNLLLEPMQKLLELEDSLVHQSSKLENKLNFQPLLDKIEEVKDAADQAGSNILPPEVIGKYAESLLELCRSLSKEGMSEAQHNDLIRNCENAILEFTDCYNKLQSAEHLEEMTSSYFKILDDPQADETEKAQYEVGAEFAQYAAQNDISLIY